MISLKLKVNFNSLHFNCLDQFEISLIASNIGDETIHPQLYRVQLAVNGVNSLAWGLRIGNGIRGKKWQALPPNESIKYTSTSLAKGMFPKPGNYELIISYKEQKLDPVYVEVKD